MLLAFIVAFCGLSWSIGGDFAADFCFARSKEVFRLAFKATVYLLAGFMIGIRSVLREKSGLSSWAVGMSLRDEVLMFLKLKFGFEECLLRLASSWLLVSKWLTRNELPYLADTSGVALLLNAYGTKSRLSSSILSASTSTAKACASPSIKLS